MDEEENYKIHREKLERLNIAPADISVISNYPYQEQNFTVVELVPTSFLRVLFDTFSTYSTLRLHLTRGFTIHGLIFIKQGTKLGRDRLILHEIGHLLGYDHTNKPNLMHPSWFFRWKKQFE